MVKNHIQPGRVLTVPAPTGGALSGTPVLIGSLFGVAVAAAASADTVVRIKLGAVTPAGT